MEYKAYLRYERFGIIFRLKNIFKYFFRKIQKVGTTQVVRVLKKSKSTQTLMTVLLSLEMYLE